jgi:hypothetical protein
MKLSNIIYTVAFALIFVVSTIMAIVSTYQLLSTGLNWMLGVNDYCAYYPNKDGSECLVDYTQLKRDLSNFGSMFIVTVPLAIALYRKTRRNSK